jgi:hypothetical protein
MDRRKDRRLLNEVVPRTNSFSNKWWERMTTFYDLEITGKKGAVTFLKALWWRDWGNLSQNCQYPDRHSNHTPYDCHQDITFFSSLFPLILLCIGHHTLSWCLGLFFLQESITVHKWCQYCHSLTHALYITLCLTSWLHFPLGMSFTVVTCLVTRHGVWVDNWIYWMLTTKKYKRL